MKILAIDASGKAAGAALWKDGVVQGELFLNTGMNHSKTILPMVENVLRLTETKPEEIDYIACTAGPGSFTGLRIGAATAKGLAHGLNIPILPVPTLDALAYNISADGVIVCPIMDARRSQVYTAFYQAEKGSLTKLSEDRAEALEETLEKAKTFGLPVIFLGDGVPVYRSVIEEANEGNFFFAASGSLYQRASSVAAAGEKILQQGGAIDGHTFVPVYLRQSQAEREREEQLAGGKA